MNNALTPGYVGYTPVFYEIVTEVDEKNHRVETTLLNGNNRNAHHGYRGFTMTHQHYADDIKEFAMKYADELRGTNRPAVRAGEGESGG